MKPPVPTTLSPTQAELTGELPRGPQWLYEPKWDGFRCLAFRDREAVALRSKAGKPLDRYFPEVGGDAHALKEAGHRSGAPPSPLAGRR